MDTTTPRITVTPCIETASCNGCGTATYTRFGQPPELPIDGMHRVAIASHNMTTVTHLCPACAYTLETQLRIARQRGR